MNVTYVSCLYNIYEDPYFSEVLKKNVQELLKQDIHLILYIDDYYYTEIIKFKRTKRIELIKLDIQKLNIYSLIMNVDPKIPSIRNEKKDTLKYMALINSKIELVYKTKVSSPYAAWIDAGISKVFKNPNTLSSLASLKLENLEDKVLNPAPYISNPSFEELCERVWWNFCGGFFACHKNTVERFYELSVKSVKKFLTRGQISWEINIWKDIQNETDLFVPYSAIHTDSMIENIPLSFKNGGKEDRKERVYSLLESKNFLECFHECQEILKIEKERFSDIYQVLSICSYYINKLEEGRFYCEKVLFSKVSSGIKNLAISNLKFYIQPLKIEEDIEFLTPLPSEFTLSSSSLLKTGDRYLLNIRAVNYRIRPNGSYLIHHPQNHLISKNYHLTLDKKFNKLDLCEFRMDRLDPIYPSHIQGLEDLRLFGGKYFFATCCETQPFFVPRIVFGSFEGSKILFLKHLEIPGMEMKCEKNWLPFIDKGRVCFIYSFNPLRIYDVDLSSFSVKLVLERNLEFNNYDFRGSAPPIPYKNGWLMTIHQIEESIPRKYYHRLLWFDLNFEHQKFSSLFYFEKIGVEYNLSITESIDKKELIFTYSINDSSSKICSTPMKDVDTYLEFSSLI